jgi:hypothetical protein
MAAATGAPNGDMLVENAMGVFHTLAIRVTQAPRPVTHNHVTILVAAGYRLIVRNVLVIVQIVLHNSPLTIVGLNTEQTQPTMERKAAIMANTDITEHYMALREALLGIFETHNPDGEGYDELLHETAAAAVELAIALEGDLDEHVRVALSFLPEFLHAVIHTSPVDYMNEAHDFGLDTQSRIVAMMDLTGTPLLNAFSNMWHVIRDYIRTGALPQIGGRRRRKKRATRRRRSNTIRK